MWLRGWSSVAHYYISKVLSFSCKVSLSEKLNPKLKCLLNVCEQEDKAVNKVQMRIQRCLNKTFQMRPRAEKSESDKWK